MIPSERQQKILQLVSQRGIISINDLLEYLDVSHMTIRRDIQKLEKQGMITSVSGGIQALKTLSVEPSHEDKAIILSEEKAFIGNLASQHIPLNASIYLDAGTTALAIAKNIVSRDDLLIVTNDFVIANYLIEYSQCKLIHTGGTVCRENRSCVSEFTAQMLKSIYVDIAFISASSWSLRGLTTPDENKVIVKKAIVDSSMKRVLVSDSSKYGRVATYFAIPLTVFDAIITDANLPENACKTIDDYGIKLIIP